VQGIWQDTSNSMLFTIKYLSAEENKPPQAKS
jgi:hypothetical protein